MITCVINQYTIPTFHQIKFIKKKQHSFIQLLYYYISGYIDIIIFI